jgi:hypothetical protein
MSFVSLRRLLYFCTPSSLHRHLTRIETSEIGSRLASGVFWSVGGNALAAAQLGDALLTAQPFEDDPDLLLGSELPEPRPHRRGHRA